MVKKEEGARAMRAPASARRLKARRCSFYRLIRALLRRRRASATHGSRASVDEPSPTSTRFNHSGRHHKLRRGGQGASGFSRVYSERVVLVHLGIQPGFGAAKALLASHLLPHRSGVHNGVPSLPPLSSRRSLRVRAASVDGDKNQPSSSKGRNPVAVVLDIPRTIWKRLSNPLSDFGFGRRSIWEGGVGLFIASGTVLLALTVVWLRGYQLRSQFRKYQVVFEFSQACGISLGTPVRIRGVTVGSVVRVNSSLKSVDAVAEVEDDKIVIPRNSLVEVNQSGLLMETIIDITPRDPLPTPSAGPLDEDCLKEGLVVCDREKIKGEQGVSLDALVGIFTRLGREMEEIGIAKSYALAEKVASIAQEAQPLLMKNFFRRLRKGKGQPLESLTSCLWPPRKEKQGWGYVRHHKLLNY